MVENATELFAELGARFEVGEVKQRTQGGKKLDFITIDSTIRRFNDVLGTDWSTENLQYSLMPGGSGFIATVSLTLVALGKSAVGIGADVAPDADKALKTALAEALKKAGHQFGVGLYLWLEEERSAIETARQTGDYDPLVPLKLQVADLAVAGGADREAPAIAEYFGVTVDDLQDEGVLKRLLASKTLAVAV